MLTTESVLRRSLATSGETLTLDPLFQGLPDTAHGGSVLAAFHALAGLTGAQEIRGQYLRRVPLGVPLRLSTRRDGAALACRLEDGAGTLLVDGRVAAAPPSGAPAATAATRDGLPLPVSLSCLACGTENPLGLRVQLVHDDAAVAGHWEPRDALRTDDGALAPIVLTTLLDEAAFWLGALASGESGMTTDLAVTLHASVPFGRAITVAGPRARVRPRAGDPRYWETEVAAWDDRGGLVADARITFVAVRGAARRLVNGMLRINAPEIVRRVFPAYAEKE